jgi:hypothetical protein
MGELDAESAGPETRRRPQPVRACQSRLAVVVVKPRAAVRDPAAPLNARGQPSRVRRRILRVTAGAGASRRATVRPSTGTWVRWQYDLARDRADGERRDLACVIGCFIGVRSPGWRKRIRVVGSGTGSNAHVGLGSVPSGNRRRHDHGPDLSCWRGSGPGLCFAAWFGSSDGGRRCNSGCRADHHAALINSRPRGISHASARAAPGWRKPQRIVVLNLAPQLAASLRQPRPASNCCGKRCRRGCGVGETDARSASVRPRCWRPAEYPLDPGLLCGVERCVALPACASATSCSRTCSASPAR